MLASPSVGTPSLWAGFLLLIGVLLALDLGLFHRKEHSVSLREAAFNSAVWIGLALLFNVYVWQHLGSQAGLEFLTGYLVEKALSVDNIFVFVVLFRYFVVPRKLQHSVLFFGILGALVMRGIFIAAGAALLDRFHIIIYIFGALLVWTSVKLAREEEVQVDPEKNRVLQFFRRIFPASEHYSGRRFFVRESGKLLATPLFFVLVAVETTDLVFAIDSIPAIFAITTDPFIVFTSNIFAILGLRALYFLLAAAMEGLRHLRSGLAVILGFIGLKMLASDLIEIPVLWSLEFISIVLTVAVVTSLLPAQKKAPEASHDEERPNASLQ